MQSQFFRSTGGIVGVEQKSTIKGMNTLKDKLESILIINMLL